jgi:methylaspartate ammonia-lyase
MTIIKHVLAVPATGGYYVEDLMTLQNSPLPVDQRYTAESSTPGFGRVREVAEGVSVGLVLDTGQVAWGDCVAVAYSGKAGRAAVFRAVDGLTTIREVVNSVLEGRELGSFRGLAAEIDALAESVEIERPLPLPEPELDEEGMARREFLTAPFRFLRSSVGEEEETAPAPTEWVTVERPIHTAVRYGVSQALLQAAALSRGVTMAEVIAEEWDLPMPDAPVPIHAQSGGDRRKNADKMIARRVASLPHALVDDIPEQLGADGAALSRYARWLTGRIKELGDEDYSPTVHLDVHGTFGKICNDQMGCVFGQIYRLSLAVKPYPLRIECPVLLDSREEQIEAMRALRDYARVRRMKGVQLVADEWANTLDDIRAFIDAGAADMIQIKMPDLGSVHNAVEAVLECKAAGVGAFIGGSCAETDVSARASVHVALATRPDIVMAKPGMGVDEGITIVQNEMTRTLAWIRHRNPQLSTPDPE